MALIIDGTCCKNLTAVSSSFLSAILSNRSAMYASESNSPDFTASVKDLYIVLYNF